LREKNIMTAGVIFYFERHDRGGIYPLNTFSLPANSSVTFDSVSYHLDNIFAQLITEALDQFIWVEDRADFNPNEGSGYGPVYSELEADENFAVKGDAYAVARQIAEKVVNSDFWVENIGKPGEKYVKYHENGVKFRDIPKTAPVLPTTVPVDSRFQVGDKLVAFLGRDLIRYTYAGVHHDPLHADDSATDTKVDNANRTIWLGVKVNRYVKEADVLCLQQTSLRFTLFLTLQLISVASGLLVLRRSRILRVLLALRRRQKRSLLCRLW
jgi:hypothetical protein